MTSFRNGTRGVPLLSNTRNVASGREVYDNVEEVYVISGLL